VLAVIAGIAISAMMLTMVGDGIGRKIVGSLPGGYETAVALMAAVMFLPQGYAHMYRAHISVDIFSRKLPPRPQAILQGIINIIGALIFGLLTWQGWATAWSATLAGEQWVSIVYYPVWPFRWMVPLGAGALTLQMLRVAIDSFTKRERNV
jgi:TRAP-type C4-dicarboxylate transport system permease small subunit